MTPSTLRAGDIAAILTADILDGRLTGGSPLRQTHLAGRFDVSRTPVREALQRLVADGIVDFHPPWGFRVRSVEHSEEHQDASTVRTRLEGLAAERAAWRVTRKDLNELSERNRRLRDITESFLRLG